MDDPRRVDAAPLFSANRLRRYDQRGWSDTTRQADGQSGNER